MWVDYEFVSNLHFLDIYCYPLMLMFTIHFCHVSFDICLKPYRRK